MRDVVTVVQVGTTDDGVLVVRKAASSPPDRARLHHEVEVLRLAAHPGVVELVPGTLPGDGFATRFVGHRTMATEPFRSRRRAVAVVTIVADTLADLHAAGVVHGRVTADHVVLGPTGPVLCGWAEGGRAGTPSGGSPPEASDDGTTIRPMLLPSTDVDALGRLIDLASAVAEPRRRPARATRSELERLTRLSTAAQAPDPSCRPSAAAVARGLREALGPRHLPARRRGLVARVIVIGSALLVGLTGAIGATARRGADPVIVDAHTATDTTDSAAIDDTAIDDTPIDDTADDHPDGREPPASAPPPRRTACDAVLVPPSPPNPAPPCTRSVPAPDGVLDAGRRYRVGAPDDELLIADLACDGLATVVVLRPGTGAVVAFDGWPVPGRTVVGVPVATLPPGAHLETGAGSEGDCIGVFGRTPDRTLVDIPPPPTPAPSTPSTVPLTTGVR